MDISELNECALYCRSVKTQQLLQECEDTTALIGRENLGAWVGGSSMHRS